MIIRRARYTDRDAVARLIDGLVEFRAPEKATRAAAVRCIQRGQQKKSTHWCLVSETDEVDGLLYAEKQHIHGVLENVWAVNVIYLAGRNRAVPLLKHLRGMVRGRIQVLQHAHWCTMETFERLLRPLGAKRTGGLWEL